jgi:hypothetical protein
MPQVDERGIPSGSGSARARDAVELALQALLARGGSPLDALDAAMSADPGWALPHTMKAGWLLALGDPALLDEASAHLAHARALSAGAPARERAHLDAQQAALEGRWHAACRTWGELLVQHPRDALALAGAQHGDLLRGDTEALRARPAQALPEWDESDPLQPSVLGLLAFGLQENNLFAPAEELSRRALAADPAASWATLAAAHALHAQGRFDDGSAWLRQTQPQWAQAGGTAARLWWLKALFRLEALDAAGVLRLADAHLQATARDTLPARLDLVALLWRLHLLGEDVAARCTALLDGWALEVEHAGFSAFHDLHVVLALAAAGDVARAEGWLARCAARALQPEQARRTNHAVARELGLPLVRALLAFARGEVDAAAEQLWPLRGRAAALGGSRAQRDLLDHTLLAAAARSSRAGTRAIGRALLNERAWAQPATPLSRHWRQAAGEPREVRA